MIASLLVEAAQDISAAFGLLFVGFRLARHKEHVYKVRWEEATRIINSKPAVEWIEERKYTKDEWAEKEAQLLELLDKARESLHVIRSENNELKRARRTEVERESYQKALDDIARLERLSGRGAKDITLEDIRALGGVVPGDERHPPPPYVITPSHMQSGTYQMMKYMTGRYHCPRCGSGDIQVRSHQGIKVCMSCGMAMR